ncbi:MAG: hypothetical protein ACU836_09230 [Gammaproteobacteria bacterium]
MLEEQIPCKRHDFFEQLHQEFLYLKGYGTYAYMSSYDADRLYDSYLEHQKTVIPPITCQHTEINFIRSFIRSL